MTIILSGLAFCIIFYLFTRNLRAPEKTESEAELINQGYSIKEAKKEARAQRQEKRSHERLKNTAFNSAVRGSNLVRKLNKKNRY